MGKVVISPMAKEDLAEIGDYIANELHNPQSALALIRKIRKTVLELERFPEMGPVLAAEGSSTPYRSVKCGNYMAFYHLQDEFVMIDRVLYARRDDLVLLFGDQAGNEQETED